MQSEISPPVTRLDAVLWFLRVQMWVSLVGLVFSFVQPSFFLSAWAIVQNLAIWGIPVLVLWLFPRVLATSAFGGDVREPISSSHDLRSLVLRSVGLVLFAGTVGAAGLYSAYLVYDVAFGGSSVLNPGPGTAAQMNATYLRSQITSTAIRFVLGFFLAFGPAIRDNFRSR